MGTSSQIPFVFDTKAQEMVEAYYEQIKQLDLSKSRDEVINYISIKIFDIAHEIFYALRNTAQTRRYLGKLVVSGKEDPHPARLIRHLLGKNYYVVCHGSDVKLAQGLDLLPDIMRSKEFIPQGYGVKEYYLIVEKTSKEQTPACSKIFEPATPINFQDLTQLIPEGQAWIEFYNKISKKASESTILCNFMICAMLSNTVQWEDIKIYSSMRAGLQDKIQNPLDLCQASEEDFKAFLYTLIRKDVSLLLKLNITSLIKLIKFSQNYQFDEVTNIIYTAIYNEYISLSHSFESFAFGMSILDKNDLYSLKNHILFSIFSYIEMNLYQEEDNAKKLFTNVLFYCIKAEKEILLKACIDLIRCCSKLGECILPFAEFAYNGKCVMTYIENYAVRTRDTVLLTLVNTYQKQHPEGLIFQDTSLVKYVPYHIVNLKELQDRFFQDEMEAIRKQTEQYRPSILEKAYRNLLNDPVLRKKAEADIKKEIIEKETARIRAEVEKELRLKYESANISVVKHANGSLVPYIQEDWTPEATPDATKEDDFVLV